MNRKNVWIHVGLAAVFVVIAAVAGRIDRMDLGTEDLVTAPPAPDAAGKPVGIPRSEAETEPEVLVKFKPDVPLSTIRRLAAVNNDRVEDKLEIVNGLVSIDDLDNEAADSVARLYAEMTDLVLYAEANNRIELDPMSPGEPSRNEIPLRGSAPNDPMFGEQWALNNGGDNGGKVGAHIDALKAWLTTQGSEEVVVAVLDSGVDYTHPDLVKNIWFRPDEVPAYYDDELGTIDDQNGFNSAENDSDPMDDNGHGTHCAGVIGAEGDNSIGVAGINWRVKLMPLKFIGRGGFGSTKNAIEAINYAVDRKKAGVNVRIINASWGSTLYSKALEDAIRSAGEQGILFVAAAGNNSTDNDRKPHYPSNYDLPNVISVAALDRTDALASFSNYGGRTVHIAAPGKDILSTWLNDAYREASGTSMATPQVAGVAALIVASNPKINVEELRRRLVASSDKLDSLNGKVESGGRLNAAKALAN